MNKTLIIMAAGMGSRFGGEGNKQTASLGPNGEMLMEYSIHDARLAGFDKFVFVISPAMVSFFPDLIKEHMAQSGKSSENFFFAVQSFDSLPEWYNNPPDRTKPYGTVAAIISAYDLVDEPFAVINADDFYGRQAFADLSSALDKLDSEGVACMLTYPIAATLSPTGSVTRGICHVNDSNQLTQLVETSGIFLDQDNQPYVEATGGKRCYIAPDTPVSMNIFGFSPWMMEQMKKGFDRFLKGLSDSSRMTAEYPVPVFLDELMTEGKLKITAAPTNSPWFGVTYQEDSDSVKAKLIELDPLYTAG